MTSQPSRLRTWLVVQAEGEEHLQRIGDLQRAPGFNENPGFNGVPGVNRSPGVPGFPGQNILNNIKGGIGQGLNNFLGGNFFRRGASRGNTGGVKHNFKSGTNSDYADRIMHHFK